MTDVGSWWNERPRQPPAEYAVRLARKRVWQDVGRCFIASVPDVEEVDGLLELDAELAHALVFVLSRVPTVRRREFADRFYTERKGSGTGAPAATSRAAAVALLILPLTRRPDLDNARVADLLAAMWQGDDLALTPPQAVADVQKAIVRARLDLGLEDPLRPDAAATIAVLETLDPSSDEPASQEVLMRASWAVLDTTDAAGALKFLLAVERADRV